MTMPLCKCGEDYATVELKGVGRVLVCDRCAALLEMMAKLAGEVLQRRPVLGVVQR